MVYAIDYDYPDYSSKVSPLPIKDVIAVMEDWFWAIEKGKDGVRFPDLYGQRYNQEQVDRIIKLVDDFIEFELMNEEYFHNLGMKTKGKAIDLPADFNRLQGASREAFVQAVKKAVGK